DNSCVTNISSATLSFDAMSETFQLAHQNREATAFEKPDSLVEEEICQPSGLLRSELCKTFVKRLFVKGTEPTAEDTWWQRVKIDTRNNKLAGARTPQAFVEERILLVPPPAERERVAALVSEQDLAPTEVSDGVSTRPTPGPGTPGPGSGPDDQELPAVIYAPSNGRNVSGNVQVLGRAAVEDFAQYTLEY